jgi:hypothetical protein
MNDKDKTAYVSAQPEFLSYTADEWENVLTNIPPGMIEAMNFVLSVNQIAGSTGVQMDWEPEERGDFGLFSVDAFLKDCVLETYMNRVWGHKLRFDGSWCLVHLDGAPSRLSEVHESIRKKVVVYDKLLREHMPESFGQSASSAEQQRIVGGHGSRF